jgi:hypothetical protein
MKVKELIKLLKTEDSDSIVLLSSDEEGNSFSPLREVSDEGHWDKDTGSFESDELFNPLLLEKTPKVVVLWPC